MSGGACFTPRLDPRPPYPPLRGVVAATLRSYLRVSVLCVVATYVVAPYWPRASQRSERVLFTAATVVAHTGTYVLCNGIFALTSVTGLCSQYRFDRKASQVPGRALILQTLRDAAVSQLVLGPLVVWFGMPVFQYFGMPSLFAPLPSTLSMLRSFAVAHLFNDVCFYWSHRLVHCKAFYSRIHKQHHSYRGPIGISAEYATPLEQVLSNQLPSIGGCLFWGAHPLVFWTWLVFRLQQTYEAHSGYCFYGSCLHSVGLTNSESAAYHDFHHTGNRGNFGALWLDWLCGTMDAWVHLGGTEGYVRSLRRSAAL